MRREREAPHGLRTYVHVGTGNYNPSTAAVYTDLGLLSCRPAVCNDVVDIFKHLTGEGPPPPPARTSMTRLGLCS